MEENLLRLRAVIASAIDGIITIDERGIIETFNPAASKIFGYQQEEVVGKNVSVLMPEPYQREHDSYLDNYHRTNRPKIIGIGREVKGKKKDGSVFPLRLAVGEVRLEEKRIYTGVIHDLTTVKNAEARILALNAELASKNEELEEKVVERTEKLVNAVNKLLAINKKLESEVTERQSIQQELEVNQKDLRESLEKEKELSELKSRFVSMASHEFRTPLSTILSSIELIESYRKEEQLGKRQRHIERVKSSVKNLTGILNDFLSLSRLEEGKIEPQWEEFVLEHFCHSVLDEMNSILKEGQRMDFSGKNLNRRVRLDKKILRNILLNLLSNAIKYSPENSQIECKGEMENDQLQIWVTDYGIGIPEDEQEYLFTRFFRARNVENIKGTGLGLNIVRRYVELLGGDIAFESKMGQGTTFHLTIPIESIPST
ncbi:MAG: PAS domain-containing sensor histidine kinase [Bacteroidota bacterium]